MIAPTTLRQDYAGALLSLEQLAVHVKSHLKAAQCFLIVLEIKAKRGQEEIAHPVLRQGQTGLGVGCAQALQCLLPCTCANMNACLLWHCLYTHRLLTAYGQSLQEIFKVAAAASIHRADSCNELFMQKIWSSDHMIAHLFPRIPSCKQKCCMCHCR